MRVHPGGRLPGLRPQGPDHPHPAVHRRLAPHRRTRPAHHGPAADDDGEDRTTRTTRPTVGQAGAVDPAAAEPARPAQAEDERPHRRSGVHHAGRASSTGRSMFATCTLPSYGPVLRLRGTEASGLVRLPAGRAGRAALLQAVRPALVQPAAVRRVQRAVLLRHRSPTPAAPRICTPPSAARSPGPSSARSSPPPTTRCGGRPSTRCVYDIDRLPEWTGPEHGYADPDTGEVLPTWAAGARPARHTTPTPSRRT